MQLLVEIRAYVCISAVQITLRSAAPDGNNRILDCVNGGFALVVAGQGTHVAIGIGINIVFAGGGDPQVSEQRCNYNSISYIGRGVGFDISTGLRPVTAADDPVSAHGGSSVLSGRISQDIDIDIPVPGYDPGSIPGPKPGIAVIKCSGSINCSEIAQSDAIGIYRRRQIGDSSSIDVDVFPGL